MDYTEDIEVFKRKIAEEKFLTFFRKKIRYYQEITYWNFQYDIWQYDITWRRIYVYEWKKSRSTKLNVAQCLPVQYYSIANGTMTFDVNELT